LAAARTALGLTTRLIGVASDHAPGIALSFAAKKLVSHPATTQLADGMACSTPNPEALVAILEHVDRMVRVTDDEAGAGVRAYFSDTHNIAEGSAGAALAGVLRDRALVGGKRIGVILSGANIDASVFSRLLTG
jgi:threonine dehydratase